MKKLITLLFSSLIYFTSKSQTTISIDSVQNHIGQKFMVCDSVYSVKILLDITFVNLGGDYPKQKLTLVFYKKDLYLAGLDPSKLYKNKRICAEGKLSKYESKAQMIIKAAKQIKILN